MSVATLSSMLSAVGLALDLVGAVALVVGLFGHARPTYPELSLRSPDDVAHDGSFGVVGGLFLVSGFVLQSLAYFDVRLDCSRLATVAAAITALLGGGVVAWLLYGLLYVPLQRYEVRHIEKKRDSRIEERADNDTYPKRAFRCGLRFWLGEVRRS